jgi:ATP-dependent DNA helicase RecG
MTATPIPRTVALTLYGDLDVSVIRELPPGRQPVRTRWLSVAERELAYGQLRDGLAQGRQAYVVCPLVDDSEALGGRSATRVYEELRSGPFRAFRVGLLHGRLDEAAKADVMERFLSHEIDLLVCTTVVEVGIDVPNATLLLVENAERFGLSQLHQLRGRVSRGPVPGLCLLFAQPAGDEARERLRALLRTTDGFALAEEDVRLRGVGELFGARQHGQGELPASVGLDDADLLGRAREDAFALVAGGLRRPELAALRAAVWRRYGETLELAEVG